MFLSLIIPCYNEKSRINTFTIPTIKELETIYNFNYEIIIVNDGSKDKTAELIESNEYLRTLKGQNKFIFINLLKNIGKGGALKEAVRLANGEFILTLDADMSTNPEGLIKWLEREQNFDTNTIYIASRNHRDSIIKAQLHRKFIGGIFNFIVNKLTKLNLTDTQCGFKLYPQKIAKELFANLKTVGFAHDVEILYEAKKKNIKIKEMPIVLNFRGKSSVNLFIDPLKMIWEIVRIITN